MQYVGTLVNPWDVPAGRACEKMQLIWDAIFSNINYTITSSSTVYVIVSVTQIPYIVFLVISPDDSTSRRLMA